MTPNKYYRLMVIACLDTFFNLPVTIVILVMDIAEGANNSMNRPYISWKNVHDGFGGLAPGISLSTIVQAQASAWSANKWSVFTVKWNEWVYVLHAIMFFGVFGTSPEMRSYYRAAFWFIPRRLGYKRKSTVSETDTVSDVAFNSNPGQQPGHGPAANRRRGSLSFPESILESGSAIRSGIANDYGATTTRPGNEKTIVEEKSEDRLGEDRED